ncbi:nitroreductase family protein [Streptomyces sp. NPDC047028]|uniref:nitroreductase family protein n=1 Tax=Streptomyces sp. NPDC047028 TaxID=3155793 RepID=UPI00340C9C12
MLHRTAGLSRFLWRRASETIGGPVPFDPPVSVAARPVPSGGRCYPVDVAIVVRGVAGLQDGAYRFDPRHHRLAVVAGKNHADAVLEQGTPGPGPTVALMVTAIPERSTPYYGRLAEKLAALEAGAAVFQAVAAGAAAGLGAQVHLRGGTVLAPLTGDTAAGLRPTALVVFARGGLGGALRRVVSDDALASAVAAIDHRASAALGYHPASVTTARAKALLGTVATPSAVDALDSTVRLRIAVQRAPGIPALWSGGVEGCRPLACSRTSSMPADLASAATSRVLQRECLEGNFVIAAIPPPLPTYRQSGARSPHEHWVAAGMALQQASLAAAAMGFGSRMHCDFDADAVRRVLGPSGEHIAALLTVGLCPPHRTRPERSL